MGEIPRELRKDILINLNRAEEEVKKAIKLIKKNKRDNAFSAMGEITSAMQQLYYAFRYLPVDVKLKVKNKVWEYFDDF